MTDKMGIAQPNALQIGESTNSLREINPKTNRKSFQINVLRQPLLLTKARNLL